MSYLIDPTRVPGAVLETWSGLIKHCGIRGRLNDFTGEQPILHTTPGSWVRPTSDYGFSNGRPIYATRQAGYAAVERMESIQGLPWNVASANCQHTTNWAALGVARSEQFEVAIVAALFLGAFYFLSNN